MLHTAFLPSPGAELFVTAIDPRGDNCHKRQKWGRFLPHQRANVDIRDSLEQLHGPENEWVLLVSVTRAQ